MAWFTLRFEGETQYSIVEKSGLLLREAKSQEQVSARSLERDIDLNETPYLHCCWQVSNTYPGLDETTETGDVYAARV